MHGTAQPPFDLGPDVKEHVTGPMAPGARNFLASGYRAITIMPMICGKTAIGTSVVRVCRGRSLKSSASFLKRLRYILSSLPRTGGLLKLS